ASAGGVSPRAAVVRELTSTFVEIREVPFSQGTHSRARAAIALTLRTPARVRAHRWEPHRSPATPAHRASVPHEHVPSLSGSQRHRCAVSNESGQISQSHHVGEGDRHPTPAPGLAPDHRQRRGALWRENVPDEQSERGRKAPFARERLPNLLGCLLAALDGIDGTERCDSYFTRGHPGNESDTDLPVESNRSEEGFDPTTDDSGEAEVDCGHSGADRRSWERGQKPDQNHH